MITRVNDAHPAAAFRISRRDFLVAASGTSAALCLSVEAAAAPAPTTLGSGPLAAVLEITADNVVHIVTPDLEFGQGVFTSLPLLVADELGADWERVEVRQSWADERFVNPLKGIQATGRSMSVRGQYEPLRRLGATARSMLCAAAASEWGVPAAECTTNRSYVLHAPSGRRATFGSLVAAAARVPVPAAPEVTLKTDAELQLVGRESRRKDVPAKTTGTACFGADVRLPNMLVATVRASPVHGGEPLEFDATRARALPGVRRIVRLPGAVAAVADNFWQASQALTLLEPRFDGGQGARGSGGASADGATALLAALDLPGIVAVERGTLAAQPATGKRRMTFTYDVPHLAHATMEPMTCTALVTEAGCQLWAPSQGPMRLRDAVAEALQLPSAQVSVERTFAGGGFGRRWQVDFGVQAALIARELRGQPVKLIWSRAEDMRHDFYRPAFAARIEADIDARGKLVSMDARLAGPSISEWGKPGRLQGKPDTLAVSTFDDAAYAIDAYRVRWVSTPAQLPIGVWRSVGQSHNGFFLECALDEIAAEAKRDPLELRLELLAKHPRLKAVLQTAARRAGWGRKLPPNEGLGIALVEDQGSPVAQVAHVRVADGKLRVLEVCCAIDCGKAVQPEVVRMQMEGGIVFALSALYYGEIHVDGGAVRESNFHDYRMLSLADTPIIRVDVIEGGLPLGGVGEPGVPPLAPAVVNAIFAASGQRIRSLPLAKHGLV